MLKSCHFYLYNIPSMVWCCKILLCCVNVQTRFSVRITTNINRGHPIKYTHNQGRRQEFARGGKRGGLGMEGPQRGPGAEPTRSRGRALVGVWRRSPQKPETHAEYSTEQSHRSSQITYVQSLITLPYLRGGCTRYTSAEASI